MIAIVDYGMGNLGSVCRALEECGADVALAADASGLERADRIVLPGVGAFCDGMLELKRRGFVDSLKRKVSEEKTPLLGICLGMQLLASKGYEGGETFGLGFISGEVALMRPVDLALRIPHVGWNEVRHSGGCPILEGIPSGCDFYFVHSYCFAVRNAVNVAAVTPYGNDFVSIVQKENVYGTQFHPEKSSRAGFRLLRNFLGLRTA